MTADNDHDHVTLIEDCEARESRLNDWERTWIDTMKNKLASGDSLTQREADKLDEVWEKATAKR